MDTIAREAAATARPAAAPRTSDRRDLPRGSLERTIRLASALLVLAIALALISAPGLASPDETPELRNTRIGAGIGLVLLLLLVEILTPRRRRSE